MEEELKLEDRPMLLLSNFKEELQRLYDHYRSVTNSNEYLRKENERLKSEAYKDEELEQMREQLERMKKSYFRGFPISEEEGKKIQEWIAKRPEFNEGAIGGRYTYQFTPTSIGVIGTIIDDMTKEKFTFSEL